MKKIALSLFVIAASGAYVWDQSGRWSAEDQPGAVSPSGDAQTGGIQRRASRATVAAPPLAPIVRESVGSRDTGEPAVSATLSTAEHAEKPTAAIPPKAPLAPDVPPLTTQPDLARPPVARVAPQPASSLAPGASAAVQPRPAWHGERTRVMRAAMTVAAGGSYADGIYTGPAVDAYYGLLQIQAIVQGGRLIGIKVLQYPSDRQTSVAINRQALPMLRDEAVSAQSADVDIISGATLSSEAFIRSLRAALRQATT